MAISKERLASILNGKARELCSESAQKNLRSSSSLSSHNPSTSDYDGDADYFDSLYSDSVNESTQPLSSDIQISNNVAENSKMPDFIKESMLTKHIDASGMSNISVIDGVAKQQKKVKKQPVNENIESNQIQSHGSQIDYSIIKAIVKDCLDNYFKDSSILNSINLKSGVITITDNKGTQYRAKLEKITNE